MTITERLQAVGACWAVSPADGAGVQPTYHIHPDAAYPHQDRILRFGSLREVEAWLCAIEKARSLDDGTPGGAYEAHLVMKEFWAGRL